MTSQQDRINGVLGDLGVKTPCRVATTANITLSGEQTIDGVAVVDGDRILVKDQTDTTENGIYVVSTTAWDRAPDFDGSRDVVTGTLILVNSGTVGAGKVWRVATTGTILPGTTAITFTDATNIVLTGLIASVTELNYSVGVTGGIQAQLDAKRSAASDVVLTVGQSIIGEGTTDNAYETTLSFGDPTADRMLTLPDKTGTLATTDDGAPVENGFRLTLTTGTPVTVADVTSATTIYCTPYKGKRISLYDGTNWVTRVSAEFSLALGTLTSGLPYDVFCYDNAGTPTLEFTAWTSTSARATALAYQDGVLVKSGTATRRYLGTFYTASTTTTEDSLSKRYLYNYYHRVVRNTMTQFTADRTSAGATYVEANSEIRAQLVVGVAEDPSFASLSGSVDGVPDTTPVGQVGIAFDSTSAVEAGLETTVATVGFDMVTISGYKSAPLAAGFHYVTVLGRSTGTSVIFSGTASATSSKIGLHHALPM